MEDFLLDKDQLGLRIGWVTRIVGQRGGIKLMT
jgi:hypothetical protein